ncbi:E3 ubiquitin-protein ligase UHRF2 [Tribolium castaneum]|uniref:RING-type E3 ubiquitin transferase n=1 Tax=Tribolium castaneum TaxID=7070 RepID=A0A139WCU0_TRICA|nr:PREDICTED: E3 ubiquitin-protein ligase UHRF2-like [Tribolium castaneum]KYB25736.1 E3 ubiquitin-protein ligase UHRF1-like Protein [Tribolium castaneum]|eukprot:XP_008197174.1 PREDICTED: E3 ubiquitin-protein ligase UHRF2-like [Tribolium castaneum]
MQIVVKIRVISAQNEKSDLIFKIQRNLKIFELQKIIHSKLDVDVSAQKLYYGGKELVADSSIRDYNIHDGDVIWLMRTSENPAKKKKYDDETKKIRELKNCSSAYYKIGDLVDVMYSEFGAWFEAKIIEILVDQNNDNAEENLIFKVVMDRNEETAPITVTFNNVRPRAKYIYSFSELQNEMIVFVNYNIEEPTKRGYWYDFKITNINREKNTLEGNLIMGLSREAVVHDCIVKFVDEVMKIEQPTLITNRKIETNEEIPLRKLPPYCSKCKDVSTRDCKECSCRICGRKTYISILIICDECQCSYHVFCLNPPLENVPLDEEWYCPNCKRDENEIVRAGEKLKTIKRKLNRIKLLKNQFGPVIGIEVGACWKYRNQLPECGIHGSPKNDIHGNHSKGVFSIILNGNDEESQDKGEEFYFTLSNNHRTTTRVIGVQESGVFVNKMIKTLSLNCNNYKMRNNGFGVADVWKHGKPVRVIRNSTVARSKYGPESGYRYDGIYKVVEYFPEISKFDAVVWRFLMRRDDSAAPPWLVIQIDTISFHLDPNIEYFMKKDSENKALWDECSKELENGKATFLETVKRLFTCVCCHEILHMPVTTKCLHNICHDCLINCFASDIHFCPTCRTDLEKSCSLRINDNLQAALKLLFPGNGFNR